MSSYETFAKFYDSLTENVNYEVRNDYVSNFFSRYNENGKKILDLACGTGTMTKFFVDKGYSVIGIDLSSDMLTVAKEKCPDTQFIKADMKHFSLTDNVDCCLCSLDAINHLTDIEDVDQCFKCVSEALNLGGIFIFDVNTPYKHNSVLADNTFVFDEEDYFLAWDNNYIGDNTVEIFLDFFIFNGKNYERYSENFSEKAYTVEELKMCLDRNSFEIIGIYDELTQEEPNDRSERIYFVCKKVK